ncbi:saxitoxin and tetrodotoxin-binding protein 1-like [Labrus mixtus]|uniref:saxitoxin and tetrodotoxin-binding protein 1-like n=1 Tax=Labrus mixtus TaxID=508554 RepID=UPI0029C09F75|nr:saxitoxin and tetrodotoxin-binding protein 1-like [Labrus mixtus]
MTSLKKTMLLLLLLVAAVGTYAAPENCDGLNKTVPAKDLHKIYGDWVLVWSVANHQEGWDLLPNVSSSHVELKLLPDNNTISFLERNMFLNNSCIKFDINMSMPTDPEEHTLNSSSAMVETDGVPTVYNENGQAQFFETCEDCLTMMYTGKAEGFLLVYKREGNHQDVEKMKEDHNNHKKLAECMGFPQEIIFTYDGAADFCQKKSSPEVVAEEA